MKQSVSGYIFHQILTSVDGGDDGCGVMFYCPTGASASLSPNKGGTEFRVDFKNTAKFLLFGPL